MFKTSRYDADIWYKLRDDQTGYDYIGTHTDDLMIMAKSPGEYSSVLQDKYVIKKIGVPSFHLGCDYPVGKYEKRSIGKVATSLNLSNGFTKAIDLSSFLDHRSQHFM